MTQTGGTTTSQLIINASLVPGGASTPSRQLVLRYNQAAVIDGDEFQVGVFKWALDQRGRDKVELTFSQRSSPWP